MHLGPDILRSTTMAKSSKSCYKMISAILIIQSSKFLLKELKTFSRFKLLERTILKEISSSVLQQSPLMQLCLSLAKTIEDYPSLSFTVGKSHMISSFSSVSKLTSRVLLAMACMNNSRLKILDSIDRQTRWAVQSTFLSNSLTPICTEDRRLLSMW